MARTFVAASSQAINFGDINALDGFAVLTVACWVKPTILVDYQQTLGKGTATDGWTMQIAGAGTYDNENVLIAIRNGSNTFGHTTVADLMVAGTWAHWCAVYNGAGVGNSGRLQFYFDGIQQTLTYVGTIPATCGSTSSSFLVGNAFESYFDGTVAEVVIYNAALSLPEISDLRYKDPRRIRFDNLIGYWHLGGNRSFERDVSRNRNDGVVTGATTANHPPAVPFPYGVRHL